MVTGFHHVALKAADFDKSRAFYKGLGLREVVGWGDEQKQIVMLEMADGGRIELFSNGGDEFSVNGKFVHFAFAVDDVEATYRLALSLGALPMIEPKIMPLDSHPYKMSIRVAFVTGPDGEQVEFFKQVQ